MLNVPLRPVECQKLSVILGDQNCQLFVYQKPQGLFVDVVANGVTIVTAVLALNKVPVVCRQYAGFTGNLVFLDTHGDDDPHYTVLGNRYFLLYLTDEDYALIYQ